MNFSGNPTNRAAVVISTRNRLYDLRRAVASALSQSVRPEIIVMDDASTDGTAEAVSDEFPQVLLERCTTSRGYIVQRNRAARLVSAPIVFSIDDDAVFSSPEVISQTLQEFNHPRIGAVAIPIVDVNRAPNTAWHRPPNDDIYLTYSFIGTAHALRRDVFLALGGYREVLVHQGEEEDYSTRLLNAGYITRCGNADPIHHFESPRRSSTRMDYYGSRNKVLYTWQNVPLPYLPFHLAATTAKTLAYNISPPRFPARMRGVLAAYALACSGHGERKPVAGRVYLLGRKLKKRRSLPLSQVEHRLPPIASFGMPDRVLA